MILREATKEAFGYCPKNLLHGSHMSILAYCELCGRFVVTSNHSYRVFCKSCIKKGNKNLSGHICTEETKYKISEAEKGKKVDDITKRKMSENHNDQRGTKNPNWQGGISFEPYCVKFNDAFKEYIRSKFGYICFLCPTTQEENGKKLSIHHVNYNKNCGCDGDETCNFVPLCRRCHSKTNGNRDYWQKLITDKLHRTIIGWNV